jgi:hypothetical protein
VEKAKFVRKEVAMVTIERKFEEREREHLVLDRRMEPPFYAQLNPFSTLAVSFFLKKICGALYSEFKHRYIVHNIP